MIDVQSLGIRIIHWEYIKTPGSIEKIDNYYQVKHTVKPNTKIKNGLLFKSVARCYKKDVVTLDLICEQIFISDKITLLSRVAIKQIIEKSFNDFNKAFQDKYEESTGLKGAAIIHTFKEQEVDHVLTILRS